MKGEARFEKELEQIAPLHGCLYVKIPDTKMLNAKNRHRNREQKRPYDANLITPAGTICIEAKFNYNNLEPHQKEIGEKIERTNGQWCVLRKIERRCGAIYRVENSKKDVLLETETIREILDFLTKKEKK